MIKLIIFDFDGVIENNYEAHYQLSKKKIINITREEHRKMFEGNIHLAREKLKHRDTGFDFMTHFSNTKKDAIIKDDIKKVLLQLSEEYTFGIITSAHEYGVEDYFAKNKISNLFSFIYGFETDKIKVHKFKKVLDTYDIKKEECIFVTDTLGDILEANNIGIKTIALDFGYHERERLQKGNPAKIISDFDELIPAIKSL